MRLYFSWAISTCGNGLVAFGKVNHLEKTLKEKRLLDSGKKDE